MQADRPRDRNQDDVDIYPHGMVCRLEDDVKGM